MLQTTSANDPNLALLTKAREHISKGELKEAAITLNKANQTMPQDARVFMLVGLMAEKAGNTVGAFENLRKAVAIAPDWGPGLLELALMLARNNQFAEAIQTAEKVHRLEPNNPMVLAGAIDIAHRAGQTDMAIRLLKHGLTRFPDDPQLKILLAADLAATDQHQEASSIWNELANRFPESADVWIGKIGSHIALNQESEARRSSEHLLSIDPTNPVFAFHAAVANGQTPTKQPVELTQKLFDGMASVYDLHMVQTLGYKLPQLVGKRLLEANEGKKFNVLDLGCGTGLLGVCLGRIEGALVGVDVSREMIAQAIRHNVYDRFHTVDIHDALEATPDSLYEIIAALDVFIYAGDVTGAIPNAHRILTPGGTFVASFEAAPESGENMIRLQAGRFAHKRSYIEKVCSVAGFASVTIDDLVLRSEGGQPVNGYVVWATKQAVSKPA